jgi:hypothetical protein
VPSELKTDWNDVFYEVLENSLQKKKITKLVDIRENNTKELKKSISMTLFGNSRD